jgi:hypothetical protein
VVAGGYAAPYECGVARAEPDEGRANRARLDAATFFRNGRATLLSYVYVLEAA